MNYIYINMYICTKTDIYIYINLSIDINSDFPFCAFWYNLVHTYLVDMTKVLLHSMVMSNSDKRPFDSV